MGLFNNLRKGRAAEAAEFGVDLPCGCRYGPSLDRGWDFVLWSHGCSDHELWSGDPWGGWEMKSQPS
ncbi:MAG: hypothetical protein ACXWH5_00985, partial [Actinomycetota bacterium]